jgi:hypothetical protein
MQNENDVAPSLLGGSSAATASRSEEEILRLVMREASETYVTPAERAAYRAGMSTSAAICDAVSLGYEAKRMNRTQIMLKNLARTCGDEIMRFQKIDDFARGIRGGKLMAQAAYQLADAMLSARKKEAGT